MDIKWEKFIQSGMRMPYYMNLYIVGKQLDAQKIGYWKNSHWLVQIDKQLNTIYYNPDEIEQAKDWVKQNLKQEDFIDNFLDSIWQVEERLLQFSRRMFFKDFSTTSNQDLVKILNFFSQLFRAKFAIYSSPKIINQAVADLLPQLLNSIPNENDYTTLIEAQEITDYQKERIAHLKIVEKILKTNLQSLFTKTNVEIIEETGRFYPDLYHAMEKYMYDYAWLTAGHHVQPLNLDKVLSTIKETLADTTALEELDQLLAKQEKTARLSQQLYKKYNFSDHDLRIIQFLRQINLFSENRKAGMSKAVLWSYPLFQEISDRLGVNSIALRQLTAKEINLALLKGKIPPTFHNRIADRFDHYVCLLHENKIYEVSGEKSRKYLKKILPPLDKNISVLEGNSAQKGKVTGKVRLILTEHQIDKVQEGEILITSMTDPNMLPAMKKAAAIVTDEGGITCHAAIVSRELKKPCIIATKIATKVFKDGDYLEVDADKGVVRKIEKTTP